MQKVALYLPIRRKVSAPLFRLSSALFDQDQYWSNSGAGCNICLTVYFLFFIYFFISVQIVGKSNEESLLSFQIRYDTLDHYYAVLYCI